MLTLEGAQAGLSWETILNKRNGYNTCFHNFNINNILKMSDDELLNLCSDERIVRNKLKIFSGRQNALVFQKIQNEFGSFDDYIWSFVNFTPIFGDFETIKQIPTKTALSDKISKDLKKRGMNFVGSTIIYAYLQAVGIINDHIKTCSFK